MSGAIPFACDAVAAAPDAHQKLHAVALLTTSLQRMKECLEVRLLVHACETKPVCSPLISRHASCRHMCLWLAGTEADSAFLLQLVQVLWCSVFQAKEQTE